MLELHSWLFAWIILFNVFCAIYWFHEFSQWRYLKNLTICFLNILSICTLVHQYGWQLYNYKWTCRALLSAMTHAHDSEWVKIIYKLPCSCPASMVMVGICYEPHAPAECHDCQLVALFLEHFCHSTLISFISYEYGIPMILSIHAKMF